MSEDHPSTADEIEPKIAQSERDGGYWLKDLTVGRKLGVLTEQGFYTITRYAHDYCISGQLVDSPFHMPAVCRIAGSTWGGRMLKMKFVGIGMYLEYVIGEKTYTTSQIIEVKELE